jgi:hypothetical protein
MLEEYQIKDQKYNEDKPDASTHSHVIGPPSSKSMIRIRINKDRKVVSHLEQDHSNNNLLFYDFNNFNQVTNAPPIAA